jgi:tetratricopeptide (TPR) repeat protein
MPLVESVPPPPRHWSQGFLRAGAVLLVVAAVGYLFWRLVPSANATAAKVDVLDGRGQFDQAYPKLVSAYGRAITSKDKVTILTRLAPVAEAVGKHDAALQYYTDLDKRQPHNLGTLMALGGVAREQGRRDVALSAYRQALALEQAGPSGPRTQADIAGLNSQITQLEAGQ